MLKSSSTYICFNEEVYPRNQDLSQHDFSEGKVPGTSLTSILASYVWVRLFLFQLGVCIESSTEPKLTSISSSLFVGDEDDDEDEVVISV